MQAGILEDRPAGLGVRAAILADPDLTERQKQVLLEIYDSFRRENGITADGGAEAVDRSPANVDRRGAGLRRDALTVAMEIGAEEEQDPDDGGNAPGATKTRPNRASD